MSLNITIDQPLVTSAMPVFHTHVFNTLARIVISAFSDVHVWMIFFTFSNIFELESGFQVNQE